MERACRRALVDRSLRQIATYHASLLPCCVCPFRLVLYSLMAGFKAPAHQRPTPAHAHAPTCAHTCPHGHTRTHTMHTPTQPPAEQLSLTSHAYLAHIPFSYWPHPAYILVMSRMVGSKRDFLAGLADNCERFKCHSGGELCGRHCSHSDHERGPSSDQGGPAVLYIDYTLLQLHQCVRAIGARTT